MKDLNTIKHLLKVQPITFVNGLPENNNDLEKCKLLPNGKFSVSKNQTVFGELDKSSVNDNSSDIQCNNSSKESSVSLSQLLS